MSSEWESMHFRAGSAVPDVSHDFRITAVPDTDVYDVPPSTHRFDAPFVFRRTTVASFRSARVTVTAAWLKQYDQGGLMVAVTCKEGNHRYVKSGVEMLDDTPMLGTVCKDVWADWSLAPVLSDDGRSTTVLLETEPGKPLWVYAIDATGKKHALREFNAWAALDHDTEVKVGVYVAKPAKDGELEVKFSGLKVVLS